MMLRHFFNLKALFFYFALATTSVSVVGSVILGHNTTNNTLVSDDNLSGDSDGPLLNNNTDVTDGNTTNKSDGNGFDRKLETDGSNGFLSKHSSNLESLDGMKEENGLIEEKKNKSFPCINWCRYTDKNLDNCWKHSVKHHATELLQKVENLYSALLHVDHWKRSNLDEDDPELSGQDFERGVLEEVLSLWENDNESEAAVNKTVMRRVFDMVFEELVSKKDMFHSEEGNKETPGLPSLSCPVPCDYYPRMWATLALVLVVTLAVLIVAVLVYLFCDSWSPRRRGKWMPVRD